MTLLKTFEQFIAENFTSGMAGHVKPIGTVKRHKLPNIVDDKLFVEYIVADGVGVKEYADRTTVFTPTQSEFNMDKVNNIIKNKSFDNPILVSNDDYIVDGHHRWKAAEESGVNISVKKIDMEYTDIISFLANNPYVTNKKINEEQL